jgi:hypothetical protein
MNDCTASLQQWLNFRVVTLVAAVEINSMASARLRSARKDVHFAIGLHESISQGAAEKPATTNQ